MYGGGKLYQIRVPAEVEIECLRLALYDNCSEREALEYFIHLGFVDIRENNKYAIPADFKYKLCEYRKRAFVAERNIEIVELFQGQQSERCLERIIAFITLSGLEYAKRNQLKIYNKKSRAVC